MKKRLSTIVLALAATLCLCFGISACDEVVYKLNFIVDDEFYATIDTGGEETITMPNNPTKDDYIFDGWYWDKDIWQHPFTAGSLLHEKLTSNMSVYAKWIEEDFTKKSYTVTFNSMGGSSVKEASVVYNNLLAEPAKPTRTGYVFAGWYKEADCSTKWDFASDIVTKDLTLYAKWADESDATGCEILTAERFSVSGSTLSVKVQNAQEYFALSEAITVSPYATWTVSSDISGNSVIPSATVSLNVGDNTYYINITSGNGSNKKQYTVNIRRREIYTVTYQPNNGDADIVEQVEEDQKPENKKVEKTGYSFTAWQYQGAAWDFGQGIGESMTLTAAWQANSYTVTFDRAEGSAEEDTTVTYDAEFAFEIPTRKGYTFNGWKTADGTLLTDGDGKGKDVWKIADDTEVAADWTVIEYTITYHGTEDATNTNKTTYTVEDGTIALSEASKAGYTFLGWFDAQDGQTKVTEIDTGKAENVELWARWQATEYTATFKADENEQQVTFTVEDKTLDEPEVPKKYGYTGVWEEYEIEPHDLTIEAVYTPIDYEIHYTNTKEAHNPNQTSYNIETQTFQLQPLGKDGYKFDGWYEGGQEVTEVRIGTTGEKTFDAHWTPIEYELHLEYETAIGDYSDGESNPEHFTIESDFELKSLVIKTEGYTFLGWFTEKNDGEGEKVDAIRPGRTESLTLYAHWELEVYTITYHNVDGVENTNAKNYTVKSEPIEIKELSKVGYTFDGWFSDDGLQRVANTTIKTGSHGNLDFYAKWTPIHYEIHYTLYEGHYDGEGNPSTYTIEENIQLKNPVREGYLFDGWYDQAEGGNKITEIKKGSTGPLALYARWIHISTITFDTKDGSPVEPIKQAAGSDVSAPAKNPTKDYYTFAGWYEDENCQTEYHFSKMPETDITVYAKWTPIEYQIIYDLDGGDNSKDNPSTYNYESSFELQKPTKVGHSFIGWFTNKSYTTQIERITKGRHGELHLYARFQVNQYTITFQTNGGTSVEAIKQNYATKVNEPASPSKNGYKFAGWYTEQELQHQYTFSTMPAENITLWAKWDRVEYDIHYNLESGDNNPKNPLTYNIESDTITLQDPTRRGYKFVGWYSDASYETEIKTIDKGSFGEKELYAKWEIISYDITYVLPEGAIHGNRGSYTVETVLTDLQNATLKGHKFDGWFTDNGYSHKATQFGGGEIGEKTFYAKFTPNTYTVWLDGIDEATATVTFNANGASTSAPSAQKITESQKLTYPTMSWDGHLFGGWYTTSACDGEPFDFTAIISQDVTLYAKWIVLEGANAIKINTSVSVTLQGKTELVYRFVPLVSGNVTITTTGNIDTLGSLYCGGKLLVMNDDSGSTAGTGNNFLIVYNVTAGEVYEIRVRAFSASANGTTSLSLTGTATPQAGGHTQTGNRTQITYGDSDYTLTVPSRGALEKFLGWMDAEGTLYTDSEGHAVKAWDKDETTVLYSKWERMEYTVTFDTSGGSDVTNTKNNQVTLAYGARLDLNLYVTTKSGQTFLGWFESLSASEPYNASSMPDHAITLYAKWTAYALGELKYDQDKTAISVHDSLNAELFGAICVDTNGKPATITVSSSEALKAGATVTIMLVAEIEDVIPRRQTIMGVKVYGDPIISVSDENRGYVNLSDKIGEWNGAMELDPALFGGSGTDTFDAATTIHVTVDGEFIAGALVTIVIHSVDPAGNDKTKKIQNVMVYGEPVITYNKEKLEVRESDELTSELFEATAKDSFGEDVTVTVILQSGLQSAGNTVTVRLTATDEKGNTKTIDIQVKVYGMPTISEPTTTDFKVEDSITPESLGLTAQDTYGVPLKITLTHKGEQKAGETMTFTAEVTDAAGNTQNSEFQVKIYGTPEITVGRRSVKSTETVDASALQATAKDSFGEALEVTVSLTSGKFAGGQTVTYTLTATDKVGNVCTKERVSVKVYAQEDIKLTYHGGATQNIKITSRGEEFSASATDSFGQPCTITLEAAEGFTLKGGQEISLYIVATDAAGNAQKSALISNIKVYDMPTLHLVDETKGYTMTEKDDLRFLFIVKDSFGKELFFTATPEEEIITGEIVTVFVQATDPAGNRFSEKIRFYIVNAGGAYVELYYEHNNLYQEMYIENAASYSLPFPDGYSELLPCWEDGDGIPYTDNLGKGIKTLPQFIQLYLQTGYQPIYSVQEFKEMELTGMYALMQDLDLEGVEWTPIGTEDAPFAGAFDGNSFTIKNFKITESTQYAGLFGRSIGVIRELGVEDFAINVEWTAYYPSVYAGGLVGYNGGTITNCHATGEVTATATLHPYNIYAGGLVGYNDSDGTITHCYATETVTASSSDSSYSIFAGGIVGYNNGGTITDCHATGTVMATATASLFSSHSDAYAGGIVGYNDDCQITDCYATGDVTATSSNKAYAGGLVGYNNRGTIKNCHATGDLTAISDNAYAYAGGLVGYNYSGTITNCHATGVVTATSSYASAYAGGLVGYNDDSGAITTCHATGTVTATSSSPNPSACAGGLVGYSARNGTITNCYATGDVTATSSDDPAYAGGLVGDNEGGTITNCYATGDVTATATSSSSSYGASAYAGGLVGRNSGGTITNCYATGDVTATATSFSSSQYFHASAYAGGLVGYNGGSNEITNCYATGTVTATATSDYASAYAGGLVGDNEGGTITNCYATGDVMATATSSDASACAGGLVGYNNGSTITNCYATGDVTATSSDDASAYAGGLVGNRNNSGDTITNCYATGNVTATATSSDDASAYAGGLVGYNNRGTITNCYATGDVTATSSDDASAYAGGLVGNNNRGTITNCYATGTVTATSSSSSAYAGGLVGYNGGSNEITNCYATGTVTATTNSSSQYASIYADAGGLVGYNGGSNEITNCYATGTVTATATSDYADAYAGGLVGDNYSGTITNCHATGVVTATASSSDASAYAGGLVGYNEGTIKNCYATGTVTATSSDDPAYAGGLVGDNYNGGRITNCYAMGDVTATSSYYAYAGGLVGYNSGYGVMDCCYATGDVTATATSFDYADAYAGGLVGRNSSGTITDCYATGDVTATSSYYADAYAYAGGLVGYNNGSTITNCYRYDGQTVTAERGSAGGTVSTYGTETALENLQSESFLKGTLGWDPTVWEFRDGSHPTLKWDPTVWEFRDGSHPTLKWDPTVWECHDGSHPTLKWDPTVWECHDGSHPTLKF